MLSKDDEKYKKKSTTLKMEGIHFEEIDSDNIAFTIKEDIFLSFCKSFSNKRGFIDGRISRLKQPTQSGVTHLMFAIIPKKEGEE